MSIKKLHNNQSGLVSILVSVTFIIILALITTSFAVLMRREQRQALDRQLSTQAFYAAESGINDAINWIRDGGNDDITDCDPSSSPIATSRDLGDGISYSCLLVDQSVDSLEYSSVSTDDSSIFRVKASDNIDKLKISWQSTTGTTNFATTGQQYLPQASCVDPACNVVKEAGMLRVAITPITPNLSRQNLINQTRTLFLYPNGGSGSTTFNAASADTNGSIVNSECKAPSSSGPYYCNVEISGLNPTNQYYVRLKSIYQPTSVSVSAQNSSGDLTLSGAQAMIDATGRANDVLRRIQVRVPITESYDFPEFSLESADDICKQLEVFPLSDRLSNNCI